MESLVKLNVRLQKVQLLKLVDVYEQLIQVTPPYSRFKAIYLISQLEERSCPLVQVPYYDELQELYEEEFKFALSKSLDIQSPQALLQIARSLQKAKYLDQKLLNNIFLIFRVITSYDQFQEIRPQEIHKINEASELLQIFTHFSIENKILSQDIKALIPKLLELKDLEDIQVSRIKKICLRYLRYQLLYLDKGSDNIDLIKEIIRHILLLNKKQPNIKDFNQLYQAILVLKPHIKGFQQGIEENLHNIWNNSFQSSIVSKFEQDVYDIAKKIYPDCKTNTIDSSGQEVDIMILIDQINPDGINEKTLKIAIEVNGVYHYSRNSENQMGRDKIKTKILENLGYFVVDVPYYHWYIVEDAKKEEFLRDKIRLSLQNRSNNQ
ncbi:UNKNOWN [Stylonychia lemnae]|uniref:RAP domain-containing protein n=1 Tax=Stylonychia lemnae TaxID=5949 RepID=A0A078B6T5_STYLE|nr:UNKNOWN [Stylonychia lemnae]|eukprot:CDW89896.1 UNKNOWN [Stylonychia lemnae]